MAQASSAQGHRKRLWVGSGRRTSQHHTTATRRTHPRNHTPQPSSATPRVAVAHTYLPFYHGLLGIEPQQPDERQRRPRAPPVQPAAPPVAAATSAHNPAPAHLPSAKLRRQIKGYLPAFIGSPCLSIPGPARAASSSSPISISQYQYVQSICNQNNYCDANDAKQSQ